MRLLQSLQLHRQSFLRSLPALSRQALLTDSTSSLFLVSEVLGDVGGGVANAVLEDFARGLQRHFGAEPATFIVEEGSSEIPLR